MTPREHPLGITSHPDWDAANDRYMALWDAAEAETVRPANDDEPQGERFPTDAVMFGMVLCMVCAAVLVGALVQ